MSKITPCPECGTKNRVPAATKGRPTCASCKAALPWLVEATDANLDAVLATKQLVVLDLWAPWCGPCRMIAPALETISAEYAGRVKVVKVNVDDNPAASARFHVQSIPMVLLVSDGQPVETMVGARNLQDYRRSIDAALVSLSRVRLCGRAVS